MHSIWKPGRAPHQRHLYDFEPEWSHKQKQGSRREAGLGGESTSLISYYWVVLSGYPWAACWALGDGRLQGRGNSGPGMSLWSHVCLTGLRAGTELIAVACRVCRWPTSCQFLLLALHSALRPFLPFSRFSLFLGGRCHTSCLQRSESLIHPNISYFLKKKKRSNF